MGKNKEVLNNSGDLEQTRKNVLEWLRDRPDRMVRIGRQNCTLSLVGRMGEVEEIDACSTHIFECELDSGIEGVHISLVMHTHALGVHLLARRQDGGPAAISLPFTIAYPDVLLTELDPQAIQEMGHAAKDKNGFRGKHSIEGYTGQPDEEEYTPYELLFPRSG
ncbi:MAG: hypothetical protein OEZ59_11670 [Deltaproteobacteria bacterium]|nr:hypothetical protein [Deltaproteobacteria bacterium]